MKKLLFYTINRKFSSPVSPDRAFEFGCQEVSSKNQPLHLLEVTTLQFPSLRELWAFQKKAALRNFHFDTADCTLRACLTDAQIREAFTAFQGNVINQQKTA